MEKYLYEIFYPMPKLAPGTDEATLKALSLVNFGDDHLKVLDIGCGTGTQTLLLAEKLKGEIIALDNHNKFLEILNDKKKNKELTANINTLCMDMHKVNFEDESFDLLWAEGSIYIMGFRQGISMAMKILKKSGYAVFSDMNYLRKDVPQKVSDFFRTEYPGILDVKENLKIIEDSEVQLVDHFVVPASDTFSSYYEPLEKRLAEVQADYRGNSEMQKTINELRYEAELFQMFNDYYGYVFYVMQK